MLVCLAACERRGAQQTAIDATVEGPQHDDAPTGLSLGRACSGDPHCLSGFCVEGVCCNTRCPTEPAASCGFNGTCDGEGACRRHSVGTECAAGTCVAEAIVGGKMVCNPAGLCVPGPTKPCSPLTCDPETNDCRSSCTSDDHCLNRDCRNGSCYRSPAAACLQDAECVSGHCAQNHCCSEACDRPGFSCALPGSFGTCAPVPDATALD